VKPATKIVDVTRQNVCNIFLFSFYLSLTLSLPHTQHNIGTNKVSQLDRQKEEGYWITEGSRKKFITPDGDELTGRRAFSAYKKTSKYKGRRKKKKTKSKGRRRKRR
jgi:hypothetical protein